MKVDSVHHVNGINVLRILLIEKKDFIDWKYQSSQRKWAIHCFHLINRQLLFLIKIILTVTDTKIKKNQKDMLPDF